MVRVFWMIFTNHIDCYYLFKLKIDGGVRWILIQLQYYNYWDFVVRYCFRVYMKNQFMALIGSMYACISLVRSSKFLVVSSCQCWVLSLFLWVEVVKTWIVKQTKSQYYNMSDESPNNNDIQLIFKKLRAIPTNKVWFLYILYPKYIRLKWYQFVWLH